MTVHLQSGANHSLTKNNPLLNDIVVGFGWDVMQGNGPQLDLVPSVIMATRAHEAISDDHFVFFNQLATPDNSVRYVADNDTEQVEVTLNLIPDQIDTLVFVVYIDPDIRKPGNFASVRNAYIRITDREGSELVRFTLPQQDMSATAVTFGEVYRHNSEWKFRAVGQGYVNGIMDVARDYKVSL